MSVSHSDERSLVVHYFDAFRVIGPIEGKMDGMSLSITTPIQPELVVVRILSLLSDASVRFVRERHMDSLAHDAHPSALLHRTFLNGSALSEYILMNLESSTSPHYFHIAVQFGALVRRLLAPAVVCVCVCVF
eukprot:GHVR01134981.1.p1 GENE.GHVR01134981.1~~GHVR01134981.1.p1  ORF type:complete len:133 (+),score=21.40 GHVR01134981.1:239-637(+)